MGPWGSAEHDVCHPQLRDLGETLMCPMCLSFYISALASRPISNGREAGPLPRVMLAYYTDRLWSHRLSCLSFGYRNYLWMSTFHLTKCNGLRQTNVSFVSSDACYLLSGYTGRPLSVYWACSVSLVFSQSRLIQVRRRLSTATFSYSSPRGGREKLALNFAT